MALVVGGVTVTGTQTLDASKLTGTASAINGSNITNLDAADLSGTLPAINGSNLTNLPAPSAANVTAGMAGATGGTAGTFALCHQTSSGGTRVLNDTFAGSNLRWAACSGTTDGLDFNRNPAGTWKCMGFSNTNNAASLATLWLRVS
jgi:hypothetical protein